MVLNKSEKGRVLDYLFGYKRLFPNLEGVILFEMEQRRINFTKRKQYYTGIKKMCLATGSKRRVEATADNWNHRITGLCPNRHCNVKKKITLKKEMQENSGRSVVFLFHFSLKT